MWRSPATLAVRGVDGPVRDPWGDLRHTANHLKDRALTHPLYFQRRERERERAPGSGPCRAVFGHSSESGLYFWRSTSVCKAAHLGPLSGALPIVGSICRDRRASDSGPHVGPFSGTLPRVDRMFGDRRASDSGPCRTAFGRSSESGFHFWGSKSDQKRSM